MDLKIKVFKKNKLQKAANIILDNHLYIKGWDLEPTVRIIADLVDDTFDRIAIAYLGKKPVGCAVHTNQYYMNQNWIMCFVDEDHRKDGIGLELVKAFKVPLFNYGYGSDGSVTFWRKTVKACKEEFSIETV